MHTCLTAADFMLTQPHRHTQNNLCDLILRLQHSLSTNKLTDLQAVNSTLQRPHPHQQPHAPKLAVLSRIRPLRWHPRLLPTPQNADNFSTIDHNSLVYRVTLCRRQSAMLTVGQPSSMLLVVSLQFHVPLVIHVVENLVHAMQNLSEESLRKENQKALSYWEDEHNERITMESPSYDDY